MLRFIRLSNRKRQKPAIQWLPMIFLALLFLSACGKGGNTIPTSKPTTTAIPTQNRTLRLTMQENAGPFDPLFAKTRDMDAILKMVFEPLVDTRSGKPQPCLATSWQSKNLSNGDTQWIFNLRKNIKFHQGQALTINDVLFTLDLFKKTTVPNPYSNDLALVKSYQSNAQGQLIVTCSYPLRTMVEAFNFPIVCSKTYQDTTNILSNGTGPYIIKEIASGQSVSLHANSSWWRPQPSIQNIVVRIMPDNTAGLAAFDIHQLDAVFTTDVTAGKYAKPETASLLYAQSQTFECLIPNYYHAQLRSVSIRKAIISALDRPQIIAGAYVGYCLPADLPISSDHWLYDASYKRYEYNQIEAIKYLEEAGYQNIGEDGIRHNANGRDLSFRLLVYNDADHPARSEAADIIKNQLAKIGIQITVSKVNWETFMERSKSGNFDILYAGISMPKLLDWRFLLGSGGSMNLGGYYNKIVSQDMQKLLSASSNSDCKLAFANLADDCLDQVPFIGIGFRQYALLYNNKISGVYAPHDGDYYQDVPKWRYTAP